MLKLLYPFSGGVWNTLGFHIRQYPVCLESKMFDRLHDEVGLPHSQLRGPTRTPPKIPPTPPKPHSAKLKKRDVVISPKIKASLAN